MSLALSSYARQVVAGNVDGADSSRNSLMFRSDFDDSSGNPGLSECDKMTVMTLPKKLQKERRLDPAHTAKAAVNNVKPATNVEPVVKQPAPAATDVEDNCPVIRASRIVFSSGRTGRTRVVFY